MNLAQLQRRFQNWLVSASDDAASELAGHQRAGLHVYQNNYRAQLVGSLQQSYRQVRAWMGDDAFHYAAVSHIERHPPHAWTLDAYGDEFELTLRELFPHNPDIHELAWIELALSSAFVARDAQPVTAAALATADWDTARLRFTPSLLSTLVTTNAEEIWWAMSGGKQRPEGQMLAQPSALLVWRRGFVSCLRAIDTLELAALRLAQENGSFVAVCELLVERLGETAGLAKAGALLADWMGSELITGID